MREKLISYIDETYSAQPEHLWRRYPDYVVFRHADNSKWFGLIMDVDRKKLGLEGEGRVDILNLKMSDPMFVDILVQSPGILRGYHIQRGSWISVLLDGTVPFDEVTNLLEMSFLNTASKKKKQESRPPKAWLIPANPIYYDVERAFEQETEIGWKQGKGIRKGDTVFMYVASPVSAILFKCLVTETDIPYHYDDGKLEVNGLMRIRLERRYDPEEFPLAKMKAEYGVGAVRGPRGIPGSLEEALNIGK